jgi:hypothetical protein
VVNQLGISVSGVDQRVRPVEAILGFPLLPGGRGLTVQVDPLLLGRLADHLLRAVQHLAQDSPEAAVAGIAVARLDRGPFLRGEDATATAILAPLAPAIAAIENAVDIGLGAGHDIAFPLGGRNNQDSPL